MTTKTKIALFIVAAVVLSASHCLGQSTGEQREKVNCLSRLLPDCPDCAPVLNCPEAAQDGRVASLEAERAQLTAYIQRLEARIKAIEDEDLCDLLGRMKGDCSAEGATWNITPSVGLGADSWSAQAQARWSRLPKWTAGVLYVDLDQDTQSFSDTFRYDRYDGLARVRTYPQPILTPATNVVSWQTDRNADDWQLTVGRTFTVD